MIGGVVLLLVVVFGFVGLGGGGSTAATAGSDQPPAVDVASLPIADTYGELTGAPVDTATDAPTDGTVVHPLRETPVHDAPGGTPIARVEPTQFGDVWFPVIAEQGEWVQVLLPSKPAGSTGWVRSADLTSAVTDYRIEVHLGSRTLELIRDERVVEQWPVAVGEAQTPTPAGRTFLLGAFSDPDQDFSPVILPLGSHSPTLDNYGGGPGTVAIHTWPDDDVFGSATSDGCIRVPADALEQLTEVPLGTVVLIDQD
ncbi:L,D-transpeptidase [Pseudonocardia sp.]|uniref:L,D-transpeptidase n=1 Tax=Pseudonocardia sp. TaxID=60912 RepID=UPI002635A5E0|nr:L,D-transpeptidase [Pseudonocardia sp.]